MEDVKAWYQSKSVWGSIVTIASMVAAVAGMPIETGDQQNLATLMTTMAGTLGALVSLVGRLRARHRIERLPRNE